MWQPILIDNSLTLAVMSAASFDGDDTTIYNDQKLSAV